MGSCRRSPSKSNDPVALEQTARFSASVIGDKDNGVRVGDRHTGDDDEWFDTASSEHDTALVAAGFHFTAGDDGDGDVRFGAAAPREAHTTDEISGDAADGATVDADPPVDPTSTSPFGTRR